MQYIILAALSRQKNVIFYRDMRTIMCKRRRRHWDAPCEIFASVTQRCHLRHLPLPLPIISATPHNKIHYPLPPLSITYRLSDRTSFLTNICERLLLYLQSYLGLLFYLSLSEHFVISFVKLFCFSASLLFV